MLVLLVIGMMLGTWLNSGVVPTMIYYGSKLISPNIFLPTACLLCSISSLATGDSWGTAGTVGIAIMVIGLGFGVPAPIVAGAVVSGAYFGYKMSPLSDTALLSSAVADVDLFDHIKYMLCTTIPTLVIALIAYFFISLKYSKNINIEEINVLLDALKVSVNINPILLLAPIFVIVIIVLKVKPLPALMGGTIMGSVFAIIFPGEMYADEYKRRNIYAKVLSRTLEESGTLTSALIPWNTCGAFFLMGALGVSPFVYLPFAILNWLNPIIYNIWISRY